MSDLSTDKLLVCLKRRSLLASIGVFGLSGCSNIPLLSSLNEGLRPLVKGAGDYPLSAQQIEASPYAMLGVEIGGVSKAIMVLAEYQGRDLVWIAADRSILVTRNGRIVRTAGFKTDLREVTSRGPEPLDEAHHGKAVTQTRLIRQLEWAGEEAGSYPAEVEVTPAGNETIQILDRSIQTQVIEESAEIKALDWLVKNRFWLDASTGAVIRSLQQFQPSIVPLTLELLKSAT